MLSVMLVDNRIVPVPQGEDQSFANFSITARKYDPASTEAIRQFNKAGQLSASAIRNIVGQPVIFNIEEAMIRKIVLLNFDCKIGEDAVLAGSVITVFSWQPCVGQACQKRPR